MELKINFLDFYKCGGDVAQSRASDQSRTKAGDDVAARGASNRTIKSRSLIVT